LSGRLLCRVPKDRLVGPPGIAPGSLCLKGRSLSLWVITPNWWVARASNPYLAG